MHATRNLLAATLLATLAAASSATGYGGLITNNFDNSVTNKGGTGGTAAATAESVAKATADANAAANAKAKQDQQQAQNQQQEQRQTATATGNGSGNHTEMNYERSAPSVTAVAPVYVRNCRIGIGAGGSNANGSFTAAIPLGNDATCLAGAALEAMQIAGGFSLRSKQSVACTIEGMEVLEECKKLAEEKRVTAVLEGREKQQVTSYYGN